MDKDDSNKSEKDQKNTLNIQNAMSITRQEFAKYFEDYEAKHGEMNCPLCRTSFWNLPSREDNAELMAVLTMPIPQSIGKGLWVFPVICNECGYLSTFASIDVAAKIRGE